MLSAFYIGCKHPSALRSDLTMEVNTMDPDQTALEQSDLGPYCLQYWPPKYMSRRQGRRELL